MLGQSCKQTTSSVDVELPRRRLDIFTGRHVLIAVGREKRPDEFRIDPAQSPIRQLAHECPFCPGNEEHTPAESHRDGGEDWLTRVFPNKYPAVSIGSAGGHEVIVESPRHITSLSEMTGAEASTALRVYAARLRHYRDLGFSSGHLFKNCRRDAGASLEHVHSQLIALHRVPTPIRQRLQRNLRFQKRWGVSISSMMLEHEHSNGTGLITSDANVVAFAPYASRAPYQMRILPRRAEPSFEDLGEERLLQLATLLRRMVRGLEAIIPSVAYNIVFHTRPWRHRDAGGCDRWHIDVIPRISRWAGYELATDEYINPVLPERAAKNLAAKLAEQ